MNRAAICGRNWDKSGTDGDEFYWILKFSQSMQIYVIDI